MDKAIQILLPVWGKLPSRPCIQTKKHAQLTNWYSFLIAMFWEVRKKGIITYDIIQCRSGNNHFSNSHYRISVNVQIVITSYITAK